MFQHTAKDIAEYRVTSTSSQKNSYNTVETYNQRKNDIELRKQSKIKRETKINKQYTSFKFRFLIRLT